MERLNCGTIVRFLDCLVRRLVGWKPFGGSISVVRGGSERACLIEEGSSKRDCSKLIAGLAGRQQLEELVRRVFAADS